MSNISKKSSCINRSTRFGKNTQGNIAIMTAFLFPVIAIAGVALFDLASQVVTQKTVNATSGQACRRIVGATLTNYPSEAEREKLANSIIDAEFKDNRTLVLTEVKVEKKLNKAEIYIKGYRKSVLKGTGFDKLVATDFEAKTSCEGIPPYPRTNELVYLGNFGEGLTGENPYRKNYGSWGIIFPEKVGWNFANNLHGHKTDNCGLELQNWDEFKKAGINPLSPHARDRSITLPPDATNPYVVELDGFCNTAIKKLFELHPGTYQLSIWYRGRFVRHDATNKIGIYLQKANPITLKTHSKLHAHDKIIEMDDRKVGPWVQYTYDIKVPEYSVYWITMLGEGHSDSQGGLFTSFRITYKAFAN